MNNLSEQLLGSLNEFLAFARGRLRDPHLAADVVQESLLKAVRQSHQLRAEQSVKAWFYRILRHTITDLHRRNASRQRLHDAWQVQADTPPDDAEERAVCACLQGLLPALKPEYAELLRRADLGGEDTAHLAETLGVSRNNLTVRLHRARRQLRQRLEQTCKLCAKHGCLDCSCESHEGKEH
jgi:RNA polymerase sigma factor (sigma-70 family)